MGAWAELMAMGYDIPNKGDKPPSGMPARGSHQSQGPRGNAAELPSDAELIRRAKAQLLAIAEGGGGPEINGRVGACRVLMDLGKSPERDGPAPSAETVDALIPYLRRHGYELVKRPAVVVEVPVLPASADGASKSGSGNEEK